MKYSFFGASYNKNITYGFLLLGRRPYFPECLRLETRNIPTTAPAIITKLTVKIILESLNDVLSETVTWVHTIATNEAFAVLLLSSLAVQFTVVLPIGN